MARESDDGNTVKHRYNGVGSGGNVGGGRFAFGNGGKSGSGVAVGYWLFKSEPDCFSFADLMAAPGRTTGWDGVRNHQARNFLRDGAKRGDLVLYYHSNADPPGVAGIAEVVEEAHPDPTQFDPSSDHFDPKSDPSNPTWVQVSVRGLRAVEPLIPLSALRAEPRLAGMELLRKGSRLSVHPVSAEHWRVVMEMAGIETDLRA